MFALFEKAPTRCVFDMRGYPNGPPGGIAPRSLDVRKPAAAAQIYEPFVSAGRTELAPLPAAAPPRPPTEPSRSYRGKTVMLIDERRQSQAEHTGLVLRCANGTPFTARRPRGERRHHRVPTLPGGIRVSSPTRIRHGRRPPAPALGLVPASR